MQSNLPSPSIPIKSTHEPHSIFIGSYSNSMPRPSLYEFRTAQLVTLKIVTELINPSFVYYNEVNGHSLIYLVEETQNGSLGILDLQTYKVQRFNTFGDDPCHITMNQKKNLLVVTNYSSGSFVVYKILENGKIEPGTQIFILHEGSGPNHERQNSPHPHSSLFIDREQENDDKVQEILLVADLGTDTIYYYIISENYTKIQLKKDSCLKLPGSGPRHMAKGPENSKILFVCGQLDSSVRIIDYSTGKLHLLSGYKVSNNLSNYPSEIHYSQENNILYLACRGDDYLIAFDFIEKHENNGKLLQLKEKLRFKVGQWPRHFNVSKTGTIYVACQYKNIVQRFKTENGKIFELSSLNISCPSCICFKD